MTYKLFFRCIQGVQIVIACGLLYLSGYLQTQVLETFTQTLPLAIGLALLLTMVKVSAIVWHRYMLLKPGIYPLPLRIVFNSLRTGLLLFSVLCSLLFLGDNFRLPAETAAANPRSGPVLQADRKTSAGKPREQTPDTPELQTRQIDPRIHALQESWETLTGLAVDPQRFSLLFSLCLGLLLEAAILLIFDILTTTLLPVLWAQQQEAIETGILKTQMESRLHQENIRHESELSSIRNRAKKVTDTAEIITVMKDCKDTGE